jgi:WD40 repeat protein/DNA repair exonuclease SbcCD ATPase subunit
VLEIMKNPLPNIILVTGFASALLAQQPPAAGEKITYEDHIKPLLENKCFSCHNPDKKKGDLDLTSFAGLMTGGGGGAVVDPGNGAASRMVTTTRKLEEPFMPPEGSAVPAKDIELIEKWINGGVLETKSSLAKKSTKPKIELNVAAGTGKPAGPIARPQDVLLEPVIVTPRTTAVTAVAASPWTSLVAFASPKQILLYDTDKQDLVGIFPYTEGYACSLRFSRSGSLLVMGGGRGGKFGHVVVWDVKTGRRVTEVGKEMDCVMSADITPDHGKIALGTTTKKVKVLDTATGEELYTIGKHTEWVLDTVFSPDGVLLATADRNGNVDVWEAANGGEFYQLGAHKAPVTDLAWRSDSNVLASCSEDGTIILWEMGEGKQIKTWTAHGPGVESVSFTPDGKLLSCGRDGQVKLWDVNGKKLAESPGQGDVVTKVVALADSKSCVSANWRGEVKVLSLENKFAELGALTSNPSQIAQRIVDAEHKTAELTAAIPAVEAEIKKADEAVKARDAQLAAEKKKLSDAQAYAVRLDAAIKELPGKLAGWDKQLKEAQAKRTAQAEAQKKREQVLAQVKTQEDTLKKLEGELAALTTEAAKYAAPAQAPQKAAADKKVAEKKTQADSLRTQLAALKQSAAQAPPPIADLDKAIKEIQGAIARASDEKVKQPKELEVVKKSLETMPKDVAAVEKALADTKAALAATQQKLQTTKDRLAFFQKKPTFLRAAQFNTNVLAEKEKLAKLETDFTDMQGGVKEAEDAKVAAIKRIEDSKKTIAATTAALPGLDAVAAKLKEEFPAVESLITPTKLQEGQVAAQADTQKQALAAKEAELKGLEQQKANRIAAAQKAVADITKQIEALGKQRNDVAGKVVAPQKVSDAKKAEVAKADEDLKAAQQKKADATKALQTVTADASTKEAALAAAQKSSADKAALEAAKTAVAAAKKAVADTQNALNQASAAVQKLEPIARTKHGEFDNAEKAVGPLRTQLANLDTQIAAQKKTLADKQADPAGAEKDFVAKAQPVQAAIAATKAALAPFEKQLVEIRAKLAADSKIIEGKRAEVAKAQTDADSARKRIADAQKTIETSTKEIADKDKAIAETKVEIAKIEPQLPPMRDKVKKLTDQYLAMLPK